MQGDRCKAIDTRLLMLQALPVNPVDYEIDNRCNRSRSRDYDYSLSAYRLNLPGNLEPKVTLIKRVLTGVTPNVCLHRLFSFGEMS